MRYTVFAAALVAALSIAACHQESPTGPSGETGLTGTWRATRAEFVSRANSSVRAEIIGKGSTMILVLTAANTYTMTITNPGQPAEVIAGTWSASIDVLTLRRSGQSGESQFDMNLNGDTLALSGGSALFAFDTVFEEAVLNATFVRQ